MRPCETTGGGAPAGGGAAASYTWHVTFRDQPEVVRLAIDYAPDLRDRPPLQPIPTQWLHLTMQGIGFTDEVDKRDLDRIIRAAQRRCALLRSVTVTLGPAALDPEGVYLPVLPVAPLDAIRHTIRLAIADAVGDDQVPESAEGWRPHVSLAYSGDNGPAEPIAAALAAHEPSSASVTVTLAAVSLVRLNRDQHMYMWEDVAAAHLAASSTR